MKLGISARDPAAAQSLLPVIEAALSRSEWELVICAQSPAYEFFVRHGIPVEKIESEPCVHVFDGHREALLAECAAWLKRHAPEALLTGLSGPGIGVDEALVFLGGDLPTYCVQDLEGLVVPGFGKTGRVYFVSDEASAELTRRNRDVEPVIVGSLKHTPFRELEPHRLRSEGRTQATASPWISFYGQPCWHLAGYSQTLRETGRALGKILGSAESVVRYRAHPKESSEDRIRACALLAEGGCTVRMDSLPSIEMSLATADLVLTAYSSCGIDQVHLQRQSITPLGIPIFIMFADDIREVYSNDCGRTAPSVVERGYARGAFHIENLAEVLAENSSAEAREKLWRKIHAEIPGADAAPARVLDRIRSDLA